MVLVHLVLELNTYLHFNSDIVNFVWKTDEEGRGGGGRGVGGEGRKHRFVNFCYFASLYLSVGEGLWVGPESLI